MASVIIIFTVVVENNFDDLVRSIFARSKVSYQTVDEDQVAMEIRESCLLQSSGVIIVSTAYARGYDLKFRVDSIVLIFSNGVDITLSDVLQMVSHSIRNQSTFRGSIIMLENNYLGTEQAWARIKNRGGAKDITYLPNLDLLDSITNDATELDVKMLKTEHGNNG